MAATAKLSIKGEWWDWAHPVDGAAPYLLQHGHNIITDTGLTMAAGQIGGLETPIATWQVGRGDPAWDTSPITPDGTETALVDPIFEKAVDIAYWDEVGGGFSGTPTNVLDVRMILETGDANDDLREFGIRGGAGGIRLFNYVVHGKITKQAGFNLERIMRFTLTRA